MKVEHLIKVLQENHKPTDDICVLLWDKPEDVSVEDWTKVCLAFDETEDVCIEATEWIADAIAQQDGTEY
jgi:hypothetical protein